MKKSAPIRSRALQSSRKKQIAPLKALTIVLVFAGISAVCGFLIWKFQNVQSLTPSEADASQQLTIRCSDTVRNRFENDLREGKRWKISGLNPGGVFSQDGQLHLQASTSQNINGSGANAKMEFRPRIKGNFVYQTNFLGITTPEGNPFKSDLDINLSFGSELFIHRIAKTASGHTLTVIYKQAPDQADVKSTVTTLPPQFKFRVLRHKNKMFVMVKDMTATTPQFNVVYEKEIRNTHEPAQINLNSVLYGINQNTPKNLTSTARFENFRIFCPSNTAQEWRTDVE